MSFDKGSFFKDIICYLFKKFFSKVEKILDDGVEIMDKKRIWFFIEVYFDYNLGLGLLYVI